MTKILLASRHGGHAASIPIIKNILQEEHPEAEFIVLTDPEDHLTYDFATKIYKVPGFRETGQDKKIQPIKLAKNTYKSAKILLKEKPDIVVPAGANTSFPIGLINTLIRRKKTIAVEAKNRTKTPSKTPLVLSQFKNTEVWVSHDQIKDKYHTKNVKNKEILQKQDYTEHKSDQKEHKVTVVPSSGDNQKIKDKYGKSLPHEEFLELLGKSETVITRAGNTAYEAAQLANQVIIVPFPDPQNHQYHFAKWLEQNYDNVEIKSDQEFNQVIEKYT